ncbi:small s protein [Delitschia confertaspora ATCC 74209]|uniref:Small s protein n=1 Tax=Delitschia confertaspora ATCC 74209 TaxID=1513339 RepID=A0A9P4MQP5_9PLEO|nr:small s protein [Delitschia confertaspora ATCC 74209]
MAEVAGLTVGVIALAGLFNNTIECFEFIQLGRNFGKNFQTSQLKLDNARLRLSRWGYSLGLNDNIQDEQSLPQRFSSCQNIHQASALLRQIDDLFADAEGVSEKYKNRAKVGEGSLTTYDPRTDLEPANANLHIKLRELSIARQNRTGLRKKARWALYEEKRFRRLIEDINELVNDLVELFPASRTSQQQLCEEEVSEIGRQEGISVLRDIAAEQDKDLEEALAKVASDARGSQNVVFSGNNNTGFQLGYNSGSISGFTFGRGS